MSARTAVVVGAVGGCGTSTVACALAVAWSRAGHPPTLIDGDPTGGDIAASWGLPAQRTLDDLAVVAGEVGPEHLRRAATTRDDGLRVIAGTAGGAGAAWTPPASGQLLEAAAAAGSVVVDGGAGYGDRGGMLDDAHSVVLICPARAGAARRAAALIEHWEAHGVDERLAVVWSHGPGSVELSARALERLLGVHVQARLPWSPSEARELGAGRWPAGRRRPLRAALEALSEVVG